MNNAITIMGLNLALLMGMMVCVWLLSLILKDSSIADIFWGLGFVFIAWLTLVRAEGCVSRQWLMTILVSLWGLRLSVHIGLRNLGKEEDRRYQAWRAKYGKNYWWVSLFNVFLFQGLLLWIISLTVQAGQISPEPLKLGIMDGLGFGFWVIGFLFESVGDWQLARFKADPENQGKVMNRGLWAYTRHPNYFGECLMWWGLFLISMAWVGNLWSIISPLTITILLLRVSGVTLLEKGMVKTRPKYRDYMESTNAFVPWFPKRRTR